MQGRLKSRVSIPFTTRIVADASAFNSPLFRRSSTPYVTLSHSRILRARLGDDRGAVEGNSRGSHGGECNEHTRPAVPPPTSVRPRSGRIVSPGDNVRRRRCRTRRCVACHSGNNATAPRSARSGWRYRGSHEGSLHSPPCDPRLFPSTAPRSSPKRARRILEWLSVTYVVLLQRNSGPGYCAVNRMSSTATPQSCWLVSDVKRKRILQFAFPTYGVRLTVTCGAHAE